MIGEGMFDVQIADYGPRSIAIANGSIHEGETMKLDKFFKEELVLVFRAQSPCRVRVLDPSRPAERPILELDTDYLALTPNFFGKGYQVWCSQGHGMDLTLEIYKEIVGCFDPEKCH